MIRCQSIVFLIFLLLLLSGCKRSNLFNREVVLAEVGKSTLYLRDVSSAFSADMSPEDSVKILEMYVDQWIKKQLKIQEAETMFESSQEDIDKMVEDYRNSLMTHKVDQYYIDKRIDTLFTDAQIAEYYASHKSDFILDKTILKARILKVPTDYRQISKLKELMLSSRVEDYQDFIDICTKNGLHFTEFNTWTDMPTVLALLPTSVTKNYDYVVEGGKLHEFEGNGFKYYMRTLAHHSPGDYTPEESLVDVIRRVIFNQRKQGIVTAVEDSLYRIARIDKKIIINVNKDPNYVEK